MLLWITSGCCSEDSGFTAMGDGKAQGGVMVGSKCDWAFGVLLFGAAVGVGVQEPTESGAGYLQQDQYSGSSVHDSNLGLG